MSTQSSAPSAYVRFVRDHLFKPVDIASLVYFRIGFGLIMLLEVWRYLDRGWVRRYWIDPEFHFTYYGFDWVKPLPGEWMIALEIGLALLAVCIIFGAFYRVAATLFFLGFTYTFLLEQARYLNHFYFVSILSFVMIFLPANRALAVDARRGWTRGSSTVPQWTVWSLMAMVGIVYMYAGFAKLNGDWLRGEPMRMWLSERDHYPVVGGLFANEIVVYGMTYAGLFLDLLLAPLLLWRRTRLPAFLAACTFHCLNAWLFTIGIFPWFMIMATAIYFPPDWPRTLAKDLLTDCVPGTAELAPTGAESTSAGLSPRQNWTAIALALFLGFQVLVPFRHLLYPGNVNWTEEGHRFSWHMKLRDKSGRAEFVVVDKATGQRWPVDARHYLTQWQERKMSTRPDMILQFAHFLREEWRRSGSLDVEVHADVRASLNGREYQQLIDPAVDLASQSRSLLPADWILPVTTPLHGEVPAR